MQSYPLSKDVSTIIQMKKLAVLSLIAILYSCHGDLPHQDYPLPSLHPTPKTLPLRLKNGYVFKPFTRDSIYPIFTTTGDLVVTGKPISLKGSSKPLVIKELEGKQVISNEQKRFPNVFTATLPQVYPANKVIIRNASHMLTNTLGDTLATGLPLKVPIIKKRLNTPTSIKALPAKLTKQATCDINTICVAQNMASDRVYDLHWSKNNRLWLATYAGISLYNGNSFMHYTREQGLPNGNVRSILEDRQGNVWFSPRGEGICKYEGDSLLILNHQDAILDDYITCITEDKQGNIWWGTNYGLTKYDGQSVVHYTTKEGMPSNVVQAIYVDKSGRVWVGTPKGLACFNNKKFQAHTSTDLNDLSITSILADYQENIWVGTEKQGLLKYEGNQVIQYTTNQGLSDNAIKTIQTDDKGTIWIATQQGNLNKFDQHTFTLYTAKEGLPESVIMDILAGKNGIVWLATESAGLVKYNPASFTFPSPKLNTKHLQARAITSDSQGRTWLATQNSSLLTITDSTIVHHFIEVFQDQCTINAILADSDGLLWLGTSRGVFKYQQGKLQHYLPDLYVLSLLKDHQGNIWIGTYGAGLWKYGKNQLLQFTEQNGLASNTIYTILQDHHNTLWFGSNEGLAKFDGKYLLNYSTREGLSGNVILSLFEDEKHQLWIGTYADGLMKFNGKTFTYYTTKEGLPSNLVASIASDVKEHIWLSTDKGLVCLEKQARNNTQQSEKMAMTPVVYNNLRSIDFEFNSVHRDQSNNLWWGANKTLINRSAQATATPPLTTPEILIECVQVNEQAIDYRQLEDSLRSSIYFDSIPLFSNYPVNPSFSPHFNHLTFRFTHADLIETDQVYYTYRIKELNQRWSKPSTKGMADYRNLPGGRFTLQVKARKKTQSWGKTLEYTFKIRLHWWQTWWFRVSILLLVGLLTWFGHQQRLKRIKKQQIVLERLLTAKTQEVEEKNKALIEAKEEENEVLNQTMKNELQRFVIIKEIYEEKYKKLQGLTQQLSQLSREHGSPRLRQISVDLNKLTTSFIDGRQLIETVEVKHPRMLASVKAKYPHLSENEVKHSLLIKLNYSPKEAAQMLGVSHNAVRMARKRLIKKFDIPEGMSLHEFLNHSKI